MDHVPHCHLVIRVRALGAVSLVKSTVIGLPVNGVIKYLGNMMEVLKVRAFIIHCRHCNLTINAENFKDEREELLSSVLHSVIPLRKQMLQLVLYQTAGQGGRRNLRRRVTTKESVWNDAEAIKVRRLVDLLDISLQSPLSQAAWEHEAGLRKRLAFIRYGNLVNEIN
jgi:hypothetical protein